MKVRVRRELEAQVQHQVQKKNEIEAQLQLLQQQMEPQLQLLQQHETRYQETVQLNQNCQCSYPPVCARAKA